MRNARRRTADNEWSFRVQSVPSIELKAPAEIVGFEVKAAVATACIWGVLADMFSADLRRKRP